LSHSELLWVMQLSVMLSIFAKYALV
jgi:hypothetical protein